MAIHVLGIRHHGPGSARNVKAFLEAARPDIVLVEGPPEADAILSWASHAELKPPVAILCYQPDNPQQSVFYPFAVFSPEWQAIQYARQNHIPVRFMDLPISHNLAVGQEMKKTQAAAAAGQPEAGAEGSGQEGTTGEEVALQEPVVRRQRDSIADLAAAAGYEDGEKWWEQTFEYRTRDEQVFEAVNEAMQVLREKPPAPGGPEDRIELLREAHMRKTIRQAEREMYGQIAVICGAWHGPALRNMPPQKEDNELLKGLPKVKVECTWIPWTYNRLSFYSGYGAGITSPGWYDHLWHHPKDDGTRWMAGVAKLFREKNMDTSVAHVMEAVRLAGALASLRKLSRSGLEELNEATLSVLCHGEPILMQLIQHELIVSNRIGEVPVEIPKPPLQLDIERQQKRLRLPAAADWKDYMLDLRKELDLERSVFLHRLLLLEIRWGQKSETSGKGTFKEQWRLQWDPAFSIDIIEKGNWGNTTAEACSNFVRKEAEESTSLTDVAALLAGTIPAELPEAIELLIRQLNNLAAASGDVLQLIAVVPELVSVSRYGNVRKTDADLVLGIVQSMITRICISLPAACTAVDEEAALQLLELLYQLNDAVSVLQEETITSPWQKALRVMAPDKNVAPVIAGYATRLLADYKLLEGDALVKAFYFALSTAAEAGVAARWMEGFLKGSGTLLLIDDNLWNVVNDWVEQLGAEEFTKVLPLLRRTFAAYSQPERRKIGEKVKGGGGAMVIKAVEAGFDGERGKAGIQVVLELLGLNINIS